jgi:hypothetical protein
MLLEEQGGLSDAFNSEWMNPEPNYEDQLIGPGGCFPGGQEWGTGWEGASGQVDMSPSIWDFGGDWDLGMGLGGLGMLGDLF